MQRNKFIWFVVALAFSCKPVDLMQQKDLDRPNQLELPSQNQQEVAPKANRDSLNELVQESDLVLWLSTLESSDDEGFFVSRRKKVRRSSSRAATIPRARPRGRDVAKASTSQSETTKKSQSSNNLSQEDKSKPLEDEQTVLTQARWHINLFPVRYLSREDAARDAAIKLQKILDAKRRIDDLKRDETFAPRRYLQKRFRYLIVQDPKSLNLLNKQKNLESWQIDIQNLKSIAEVFRSELEFVVHSSLRIENLSLQPEVYSVQGENLEVYKVEFVQ